MNDELKKNLSSSQQWIRLLYMLFFAVCMYLATVVISIMVVVQFLFAIITGSVNTKLRDFSASLATYIGDIWFFLTYNRETKPFPFEDWPSEFDDEADPDLTANSTVYTDEQADDDISPPESSNTGGGPAAEIDDTRDSDDVSDSDDASDDETLADAADHVSQNKDDPVAETQDTPADDDQEIEDKASSKDKPAA